MGKNHQRFHSCIDLKTIGLVRNWALMSVFLLSLIYFLNIIATADFESGIFFNRVFTKIKNSSPYFLPVLSLLWSHQKPEDSLIVNSDDHTVLRLRDQKTYDWRRWPWHHVEVIPLKLTYWKGLVSLGAVRWLSGVVHLEATPPK